MECTCKPGTHENGWQEERSDECQQLELDEWVAMMDKFKERKKDETI